MSEVSPESSNTALPSLEPGAAVILTAAASTAGMFQFFLADQRWVWSDAVARMHGYQPGQVQPTTELLLNHKHPDDRAEVAEILQRVQEGGLFSSRHRIVDAGGHTRWVVVVSDRMIDSSGTHIGTQGYYIDVTTGLQSDITAAMTDMVESRAIIEQAKGILKAAYSIEDDRAFEILKWRSQTTQKKLKDVAARFVKSATATELSDKSITVIDQLLLADDDATE